MGRKWTTTELFVLRRHYHKLSATAIANRIGRSTRAVYMKAAELGMSESRSAAEDRERLDGLIREKHALGWPDTEIANQWGCSREWVGERRRAMGLPSNALSQYRRAKVARKTAEQLRAAGLESLAQLRVKVYRERARAAGWPEDLRPRAVQILNFLHAHGPATRRQIADAIGMPWKGSRKSLVSNDPEGSYLAHLIKRGLVVSLGRMVKGKGRGRSVQLYALPLWVEPQHRKDTQSA